jgi:hypothetical protein
MFYDIKEKIVHERLRSVTKNAAIALVLCKIGIVF